MVRTVRTATPLILGRAKADTDCVGTPRSTRTKWLLFGCMFAGIALVYATFWRNVNWWGVAAVWALVLGIYVYAQWQDRKFKKRRARQS